MYVYNLNSELKGILKVVNQLESPIDPWGSCGVHSVVSAFQTVIRAIRLNPQVFVDLASASSMSRTYQQILAPFCQANLVTGWKVIQKDEIVSALMVDEIDIVILLIQYDRMYQHYISVVEVSKRLLPEVYQWLSDMGLYIDIDKEKTFLIFDSYGQLAFDDTKGRKPITIQYKKKDPSVLLADLAFLQSFLSYSTFPLVINGCKVWSVNDAK